MIGSHHLVLYVEVARSLAQRPNDLQMTLRGRPMQRSVSKLHKRKTRQQTPAALDSDGPCDVTYVVGDVDVTAVCDEHRHDFDVTTERGEVNGSTPLLQ